MKNQTIATVEPANDDASGVESTACDESLAVETFRTALRVLSGKWKGEILCQLVQGTRRFGELRRSIPGITQHMLTTQLRDLEAHGLVKRTIYAEVPPRVEYELTPSARDLEPVFRELLRWSDAHGDQLSLMEHNAGRLQTQRRAARP